MIAPAILDLLKVFTGFFVVLALWVALQHLIRRHSRIKPGRDVLEFMLGGCGNCLNSRCDHHGACDSSQRKDSGTS